MIPELEMTEMKAIINKGPETPKFGTLNLANLQPYAAGYGIQRAQKILSTTIARTILRTFLSGPLYS